jgi:hypothetical protein
VTLTEFLLARIGEDERGVREGMPDRLAHWRPSDPYHYDDEYSDVTMSCGRALVEIEAKRSLIASWPETHFQYFLRVLAAIYADHPDYQEEWKP